jgi:hypothetical protein
VDFQVLAVDPLLDQIHVGFFPPPGCKSWATTFRARRRQDNCLLRMCSSI